MARSLAGLMSAAACVALFACSVPAPAPEDVPDAAVLMNELMSGRGDIGGDFDLAGPDGKPRNLASFRGRIVLLYFGYTSCADTCPVDLAQIAQALRLLGPRAREVQPVFVTLDPARDTPAVIREYAAAFDPRIVPLRGTEAETRRIATSYKIYFQKQPIVGGGYVVDHAAFTFLLDREGRYVSFFPPGTPAARIATIVRDAL